MRVGRQWHVLLGLVLAAAALSLVQMTTASAQANEPLDPAICAALADARALILSPGPRILLGEANNAMNRIAGLTAKSLRLDSCRTEGIALKVAPNGDMQSYWFDFEEFQDPDLWCGFGMAQNTGRIVAPYCRVSSL